MLDPEQSTGSSHKRLRALLVGGSGFLGRRLATRLISRHIHVIVHGGRSKLQFRETIKHLKSIDSRCVQGVWAPIRNHHHFYRKIVKYLPVEIMIIFYGPYIKKSIVSTTYQDWQAMAMGNFALPASCLSANMEYLQNTQYGRVVCFASDYRTNMGGYRQIAAYAAAKWALSSVIQSAAAQNTNLNTKFYLLAPGYIDYHSPDSLSDDKLHRNSVDDVVHGILDLLDQNVNIENGSTIELDRIKNFK